MMNDLSEPATMSLCDQLRVVRQWCCEAGDYSPSRPLFPLAGGGYLQPQLKAAAVDGELCGCWLIVRVDDGGRKVRSYQV